MQSHINTLHDISYSRPEFSSVGFICYISAEETGQITFKEGEVSFEGTFKNLEIIESSGVYIGKRTVITAAHSIPMFAKDGQNIGNLNKHWYFFANSKAYRIVRAKIHPLIEQKRNKNHDKKSTLEDAFELMTHDVAVLLLEKDPIDIPAAILDDKLCNETTYASAIGYSTRSTEKSSSLSYPPKTAGIIPTFTFFNANSAIIASYDLALEFNPLNINFIAPGMSGGGLFSKSGKLIAIIHGAPRNIDDYYKKRYSFVFNSAAIFPSMYGHKTWLKQAIDFLQDEKPTTDKVMLNLTESMESAADARQKIFPKTQETTTLLGIKINFDIDIHQINTLQHFSQSRPEFDSIGLTWSFSDNSTGKINIPKESQITFHGTFSDFAYDQNSAVYIGKQIALTSAHTLPAYVKDAQFIEDLNKHFYFYTHKKFYRVLEVKIHPMYDRKASQDHSVYNPAYDLAVLLLEKDPDDIPAAVIDEKSYPDGLTYITAIGYSDRSNTLEPSIPILTPRTAALFPLVFFPNNQLGHAPFYSISEGSSRKFNAISYGMAGGGWFSPTGKIVAITSLMISKINNKLPGDTMAHAANIGANIIWINQAITFLQNEIPKASKCITSWYENRKRFEEANGVLPSPASVTTPAGTRSEPEVATRTLRCSSSLFNNQKPVENQKQEENQLNQKKDGVNLSK